MNLRALCLILFVAINWVASAQLPGPTHRTREISGWTLHISQALLTPETAPATERALALLKIQLEQIIQVVPAPAVAHLQKVPLWFSPEYPGIQPRAEYHSSPAWLREHQRNPEMAKGVEFTNVRIFEAECRRMPNFALHELAHSYHDRILGSANSEIATAYEAAKTGGKYERVERRNAEGQTRFERAYALTNAQEYFAESTEAYFATNDFFPYTRDQLQAHDPAMLALLNKLWSLH